MCTEEDYAPEFARHNAALYAESVVDHVKAELMENPELSVRAVVEDCLALDGFASKFMGLEYFIVEAVAKHL